jgi:hypothetical protein
MTMMTIQSQVGTRSFRWEGVRLYDEPTRICNVCGLRREENGSRSGERAGEPREDSEIGVERDPLDTAHAERAKSPLVLQASELALDAPASAVQAAPPLRGARDKRMETVGLDPAGRGRAMARGAAPLGRLALRVGPGEYPRSVVALGRRCAPRFTAGVSRRGMIGSTLARSHAS